jgi:NADPH:quinone reductase-like Zn-dependent oxidoreductase
MKAFTRTVYGGPEVLRLEDLPMPTPAAHQLLIRVRAASVNPLDWHYMRGKPYIMRMSSGYRRPKRTRIGADLAGEVVAVGANVSEFKPGDRVFGTANGAFGEYNLAGPDRVAPMPAGLSFEEAAAVPVAGTTALEALRDQAKVQAGQRLLINGAAGGVGTFAVQLAKAFGLHVTGVCSARNIELVRSLGADRVIDYGRESFIHEDVRYDAVLDSIGNHPITAVRRVLTPTGTCVVVGGPDGRWLGPLAYGLSAVLLSPFVSQSLRLFIATGAKQDFVVLRDLIEAGKLKPAIDRCYPLAELPEAIRYLETGHARAKVVIQIG